MNDLVDVFASWRDLGRSEKKQLLEAYQIRISVDKVGERKAAIARVESVTIGYLRNVVIYNKMKRLGIDC